jgi:hypothetical protein
MMKNKKKLVITSLSIILVTILMIIYLPSIFIHYEYRQLATKEVEEIIAENQFIDWVPTFEEWMVVSGYRVNDNNKIYKVDVQIEGKNYPVILDTRVLNNDEPILVENPKARTRPAIYGTIVKYKDNTYGLKNLSIEILSEKQQMNK